MGIPKHEVICGIYKIISPTGKIYIGQSIDIYKAWYHRYNRGHCKNQNKLYNSIKKYGWEAHKKEIIHRLDQYDIEKLNALEKYYEELYDSTNPKTGLNLRRGGGSHGKMSDESRKKMSESKKGEKNYWFGKTHSEEARQKIREANTGERSHQFGKPLTHSQSEVLRQGRMKLLSMGPHWSPEGREKISQTHKGNKWSLGKKATEEQRKNRRERSMGEKNPFFGKKHTNESKQKVSATKSKIILNTQTGIFYYGLKEISKVCGVHVTTLCAKLNGRFKNDTSFIYV